MAIIGYGSQGRTHALNLRDSGVRAIRVALKPDSATRAKAQADGFQVVTAPEAAAWGEVIAVMTSDEAHRDLWRDELAPYYDQAKRMLGVVSNPTLTPADEVMRRVRVRPAQAGADPGLGGAQRDLFPAREAQQRMHRPPTAGRAFVGFERGLVRHRLLRLRRLRGFSFRAHSMFSD